MVVVHNQQYRDMYDFPDEVVRDGASLAEAIRFRAERGDYGPGDPEDLVEQRMQGYIERITLRREEQLSSGRIIELIRTPVEGGGVVGIATDITERKRQEEALQKSEQQLRRILEDSPIGVSISIDDKSEKDGIVEFANPRFLEMLGFDETEVGKIKTEVIWPKGQSRDENQEALDRGESSRNKEQIIIDRKGVEISTLMSISPIDYRDRKSALIWFYDITERKQAEEELRVARDVAEEATKAKATFLATMSHEIRTPMGGVIGMVDLLQQSKMTDDQRQMIDTVRDSAHSLLTIINDILDFSKIEAGKLDLEEIPISVRDIVEGAGEALAVNARNKGIGLSVYVDPEIPNALVGDQVRLRQILFNFGSNAIKFTERGKVLIRADTVPSPTDDGVTVRFQVIDEGIGIPEEAQKKLFQAFSQVEASTTRRFGGTGLGLSICQRLTELMNGEIGVESALGEGSSFSATITLPVAKEHTIKSDGHDLDGLNVLFAVGDDDMRDLLPRYLEHWGATVTAIADPGEVKSLALEAAATDKPFNVICLGTAWPLAERIELVEFLAAEKALSSTRYVIACRERARGDRKEIDNTVYMDTDPLRRGSLIKSVAVAAGRASPDVEYDDSEITLDAGKAPTVAEAEAMEQLILLAEDNVTNQDVIRRQLTMLGYALEIANDGKEALDLMDSRSFAVLLTDCHMPNIDGFELTETIRKSEKGKDGRFPIIAITASVMKEEIDHCFASGMDDYLPKPLEMVKLRDMLQKWMPAPIGGPPPEDEAAEDEIAVAPTEEQGGESGARSDGPIDSSALTDIFGDDADTVRDILADFVDPAWQSVIEMEGAFEQRKAEEIGALGHKLKSSSRAVGANALADLCQALETAGKAEDWPTIEDAVPRLRRHMQDVADYIAAQ